MKKLILIFLASYILIPLACLLIVRNRLPIQPVVQHQTIDIIHENGVEYWCNKDFCWRSDPNA
jgi:hypothetical protein